MGYRWSRTISVMKNLRLFSLNLIDFYRSITRAYYRNSVGVLLIYDTTNYVSFTHVTNWLNDARAQIEPYHCVFLLVGTKIDRESERQVTKKTTILFSLFDGMFIYRSQPKKAKHLLIFIIYPLLKPLPNLLYMFKKPLH
jgi:GTPase SAR1 family protein